MRHLSTLLLGLALLVPSLPGRTLHGLQELESLLSTMEERAGRDPGWLGDDHRFEVLQAMRLLARAENHARELALSPYGSALADGLVAAREAPGPRVCAARLRLARVRFGEGERALGYLESSIHRAGLYPTEQVSGLLRAAGRRVPETWQESVLLTDGSWLLVGAQRAAWIVRSGQAPERLAVPRAALEIRDLGFGGVVRIPAGQPLFTLVRRLADSSRQLLPFVPSGSGYRSVGALSTRYPRTRVKLWAELDGETVVGWRLREGGDVSVEEYELKGGRLRARSPARAGGGPPVLRLY